MMPRHPAILKGVIRGKTIELEEEPGLPDGQEVRVTVEPVSPPGTAVEDPLDALKRAAGGWSDDPDGLDRYLEWNRRQRKVNRPEIRG
jgi:hypothetical protein